MARLKKVALPSYRLYKQTGQAVVTINGRDHYLGRSARPKTTVRCFAEGQGHPAEFDKHRPQVVVVSSRGGAVAMKITSGDTKLVLLCPAWKKCGTTGTVKPGTVILHCRADEVI
jgi:hypothetical protein